MVHAILCLVVVVLILFVMGLLSKFHVELATVPLTEAGYSMPLNRGVVRGGEMPDPLPPILPPSAQRRIAIAIE